jgi:hypothetical protein
MKKFMQKDLSKAPNFVNRAILRTAPVLSQKSQKKFAGLPIVNGVVIEINRPACVLGIGSSSRSEFGVRPKVAA